MKLVLHCIHHIRSPRINVQTMSSNKKLEIIKCVSHWLFCSNKCFTTTVWQEAEVKCLTEEGTTIGERVLMVQENIAKTQVSLLGVGGHRIDSGGSSWCRRTSQRLRWVFLVQDEVAQTQVSLLITIIDIGQHTEGISEFLWHNITSKDTDKLYWIWLMKGTREWFNNDVFVSLINVILFWIFWLEPNLSYCRCLARDVLH